MRSGLAGHTKQFARSLSQNSTDELYLVTTQLHQESDSEDFYQQIYKVPDWHLFSCYKILRWIKQLSIERVFLQWLPYLYSSKGINFYPVFLVIFLRIFSKVKIEIYFHEIGYPFLGNIKSFILNRIHYLMTKLLLWFGHVIFVNTYESQNILKKITNRKILFLPVGSNILREDLKDKAEPNIDSLFPKAQLPYFVLFGDFHPSKEMVFLINSLFNLHNKSPFSVVHIGVTNQDYSKQSLDYILDHENFILLTGKIDDAKVATILSGSNGLITFFTDGATTRRGTLLSALEFGIPVITTISSNSEPVLKKYAQIWWSPCDKNAYLSELEQFIARYIKQESKTSEMKPPPYHPLGWKEITTNYLQQRTLE